MNSPDVALVSWNTDHHMSGFLEKLNAHNRNISLTVLRMDGDDKTVPNYSTKVADTTFLTSKDCEMDRIKDLVISRDISNIHYMYHADDQMSVDNMTSSREADLFKCQIMIIQAMTDLHKHQCHVYFHVHVSGNPGTFQPADNAPQHACEIITHLRANNRMHNTIRILEMHLDVFQRLYNFKYYYVI